MQSRQEQTNTTLLPLRFYSKWLCWFPVGISSALRLSRPSSHSAASCPSPDPWHRCTSTPNSGSTPMDREEQAYIRTRVPQNSFIFSFPTAVLTIHKHYLAFQRNKIKKQYRKIQAGNISWKPYSFFRVAPPKEMFPVPENKLQLHALKCDLVKCLLRYSASPVQAWTAGLHSHSCEVFLLAWFTGTSLAVEHQVGDRLWWFCKPHYCPLTPTPSSTCVRTKGQQACFRSSEMLQKSHWKPRTQDLLL